MGLFYVTKECRKEFFSAGQATNESSGYGK
jgi:hypothetical protein